MTWANHPGVTFLEPLSTYCPRLAILTIFLTATIATGVVVTSIAQRQAINSRTQIVHALYVTDNSADWHRAQIVRHSGISANLLLIHANTEDQAGRITAAMGQLNQASLPTRIRTERTVLLWTLVIGGMGGTIVLAILLYSLRLEKRELIRAKERQRVASQNAECFKDLTGQILQLGDSERRRVARALHDNIGQFLAGLKMNFHLLGATTGSLPKASALLADADQLMDQAIAETRQLSNELHPPLLDELGLTASANWCVEEFTKRSGITVTTEIDALDDRLSSASELVLFRVLEESLRNIHLHAMAKGAFVRLTRQDGEVTLEVRDDGKGIPESVLNRFRAGAGAGVGLFGMRQRLANVHGKIEIDSSTAGTRIRAALPAPMSA